MSILEKLGVMIIRGAIDLSADPAALGHASRHAGDLAEAAAKRVAAHLRDPARRLPDALEYAAARAWRSLEMALAGDSFWTRCAAALGDGESRGMRQALRQFLDAARIPESERVDALAGLRQAREAGDLTGWRPERVADGLAALALHANREDRLAADQSDAAALVEPLRARYPALAQVAARPAADGVPVLVVAARSFFRRRVEADPALFRGLTLATLDAAAEAQEAGFRALDRAMGEQESVLNRLLAEVSQTRADVLEIRDRLSEQSDQVRQVADAVGKLLEAHQLARREVRVGDSLSIRDDRERELARRAIAGYRALPQGERDRAPDLLNAVGKLEFASGDFAAARRDFQAAAETQADNEFKAEAHFNGYRAALEERDWPGATQELVKAVKLAPKRYAPFPTARYSLVKILGAGGFGVAFHCRHRHMNADVVIKSLTLDELGGDSGQVFAEAQTLRELDHPNIVKISDDCGYVDSVTKTRAYMVMDYFAGGTLEEHVQKLGTLPPGEMVPVARMIAAALRAAHQQRVLHRDVKPANVLVRRERGAWSVRLIDFGLALRRPRGADGAKSFRESMSRLAASTTRGPNTLLGGGIAGTLDYGAPEQMGRRPESVGTYSDVYGWAKTCCFGLFRTTNPTLRHWDTVPRPLADLLGRCLEEDPALRPQTFGEVVQALDGLSAAAPAPAAAADVFDYGDEDETPPARAKVRRRGRQQAVGYNLALVGVLAAVAFVGVVMLIRDERESDAVKAVAVAPKASDVAVAKPRVVEVSKAAKTPEVVGAVPLPPELKAMVPTTPPKLPAHESNARTTPSPPPTQQATVPSLPPQSPSQPKRLFGKFLRRMPIWNPFTRAI